LAKHGGGRHLQTKPDERQAMAVMKATGMSNREISRQTGRSRATVAAVLKAEDVQRLMALARDRLDRAMPDISQHFLDAIRIGAAKGNGDAAYRALLSLGVISRPDDGTNQPRTVVNIGQVVITGAHQGHTPVVEWRKDDGTYGELRPLDVAEDAVVVRTISVKPTDD